MKTQKGIIKINPYRFYPVVVSEHCSTEICKEQKDFAFNNINLEVEFYVKTTTKKDKKDYAIIIMNS